MLKEGKALACSWARPVCCDQKLPAGEGENVSVSLVVTSKLLLYVLRSSLFPFQFNLTNTEHALGAWDGQAGDMEQEVERRKHLPQPESAGSGGWPDTYPIVTQQCQKQRLREVQGLVQGHTASPLSTGLGCLRVASSGDPLGQYSSRKTGRGGDSSESLEANDFSPALS